MRAFDRKKKEFHYWMGGMHTLAFMMAAVLIFAALTQLLWLIPWVFIVLGLIAIGVLPLPGRNAMLRTMKRWLGVDVVNMKLNAVATYLKVSFLHIPEHYECEKLPRKR